VEERDRFFPPIPPMKKFLSCCPSRGGCFESTLRSVFGALRFTPENKNNHSYLL
jgi:hypothetical protein